MLIVATAGHIDHGKTSLVRALTGVDTDTLPQERARGISIDLGFAYWEAAPGELVAFVDVPGHHRFIRNMLAGVAAIDFALIVVAADDGPMPQTVEHVQILDFLGVRRGAVVLSKCDTVDASRIAEVRAGVASLLRGTALEGLSSFEVSARTGAGIPALQALLAGAVAGNEQAMKAQRGRTRQARFAIDRVFTVRGAGTVATGTVYDGELACEDRLAVYPGGEALRVRGLQVHGKEVTRVASGHRVAVNLAAAKMPPLARGDWLAPAGTSGGSMLDVRLALQPGASPLRHASSVRLHLGASEVIGRLLIPGRAEATPGSRVMARLQLDKPVLAVNGDRFVLRDVSGLVTLAGGIVIDPCPVGRRRQLSEAEATGLASGDPTVALAALLDARGGEGVELARFERIFHLSEPGRASALEACGARLLGKTRPVILRGAIVDGMVARAAEVLNADPRESVPLVELREAVAPQLDLDAFESLLREHAQRLDISIAAGGVSLRSRRDNLRSADQAAWERVRPLIVQAGLDPPDLADLAGRSGVPAGRLRAILHWQSRSGEVFQLRPDRYLARELVARLAAAAATTAQALPGGRFTAAQYRDTIGTGRTLAIHVLEMLDVAGITRRTGDARTLLRQPRSVFGEARPFVADHPPPMPPRARPKAVRR